MCENQTIISAQCAAHSVGLANSLFMYLIQTLLAAHCSLSPSEMWPKDFGEVALKKGCFFYSLSTCSRN